MKSIIHTILNNILTMLYSIHIASSSPCAVFIVPQRQQCHQWQDGEIQEGLGIGVERVMEVRRVSSVIGVHVGEPS